MNVPKIALCLITKNSAGTIEQLLDSVRPFVDGIFVYDTGSTDDTIALLTRLGEVTAWTVDAETGQRMVSADWSGTLPESLEIKPDGERTHRLIPVAPITVQKGEWRDDFSWARERSWEMPDESFTHMMWADDDDVIGGAENLRMLAASLSPEVDGLVTMYDYARDEHGNCVCVLWRERLMRRAAGYRWLGAVHEVLVPPDGKPANLAQLPPNLLRYIHNRPADRYSPERNLDILRAEEKRCADAGELVTPRTLAYLGTELMSKGRWQEAAVYLDGYLDRSDTGWSDERMQVAHKLATCARMMGDPLTSVEVEMRALRERDDWAETYVGLAESFAQLERWDRVERWAKRAIELGAPQTALIVNPLEFSLIPALRVAEACAHQGRFTEVDQWIERASAAAPGQAVVAERAQVFQRMRLEGETLQALLHLREILVRFDENEKAFRLMEAAPYIVADHPAVVKARADQREMVRHLTHPEEYRRWYEDEPKESTLLDEHIDHVGEWFGRVAGLERGLADQEKELGRKPRLLDLGCNDGWMLEYFSRLGYECDGVELNKGSVDKALERRERFGRDWTVVQGDLHDAARLLYEAGHDGACMIEPDGGETHFKLGEDGRYDAISLFEVFEHVPDTDRTLEVMESLLRPGGRVYVSTPNGAFEQGRIDRWATVERKGHLRAIPIHEFAEQLMRRGELEDLEETNGDRVAFAAYTPKPRRGTVTFYAGGQWEPWSPLSIRQGGIGGSETALVQVATRLANEGWIVKVYSSAEPSVMGGVLYRPFTSWDPTEEVDLLVVSRMPHVFDNPVAAKQTALWCHDHSYPEQLTEERAEKIDHIVTLSEWQRDRFARLYPFAADRLTIVRNGITLRELDETQASRYPDANRPFRARKPRVVYSSSADRGLDVLLGLWPQIRKRMPQAELHVFYGFETLDRVAAMNPQLAAFKTAILGQIEALGGEAGGVYLRGRVGQVQLAEEMQQARVLGYPTAFLETSCITAMEARAAGLPIVSSDLGALSETVGEHGLLIEWDADEDEPFSRDERYQATFVDAVVTLLSNEGEWEIAHKRARADVDELDWSCRVPDWEALAVARAVEAVA